MMTISKGIRIVVLVAMHVLDAFYANQHMFPDVRPDVMTCGPTTFLSDMQWFFKVVIFGKLLFARALSFYQIFVHAYHGCYLILIQTKRRRL